jgi:hypothetical protein
VVVSPQEAMTTSPNSSQLKEMLKDLNINTKKDLNQKEFEVHYKLMEAFTENKLNLK